ncbi:MAG: rRNA small subunit methyltransferase 1 [Clostridiales bacterium]|nr:rRNA small subunit methyltransferase 1 [Clostridiales bacterium]
MTIKLLNHYGIHTPQTSYHLHNEKSKGEALIQKMIKDDIDIALVTDAGTPAISDPGAYLVQQAIRAGIQVIPIPGASAVIAALSASGFDLEEFTFFGFLPREKKLQQAKILSMEKTSKVGIVYESPYRVHALMENLAEVVPLAQVALFSDLTKHFERVYRGTGEEILGMLKENPKAQKGEYAAVIKFEEKAEKEVEVRPEKTLSVEARLFDFVYQGKSLKESIQLLVKQGEKKNEVYQASIKLKTFFENIINTNGELQE